MSDTPRTDALEGDFEYDTRLEDTLGLCRILERENTSLREQLRVAQERWISVKDRLPEAKEGISYQTYTTGVVLVIHSDRPDYPITAHASLGDNLSARGLAIPTNGASKYKEIAWCSAGRDLVNPFDLKNKDYERYMPSRFGLCITHWMPLPTHPLLNQRRGSEP